MDDKEFEEAIERYLSKKMNEMKAKYDRVLPVGELLFNRFDKARYLDCGNGSSIYDSSVVMGDVIIGENVWIGPNTLLEGANAKIQIGNNVSIDTGVCIYTHDTTKMTVSGGREERTTGEVTIGDNTVIGTMSTIMSGVKIGSHCVIGAYSLVKSDVPDGSIVFGVPAKVVGCVKISEDTGTVSYIYDT